MENEIDSYSGSFTVDDEGDQLAIEKTNLNEPDIMEEELTDLESGEGAFLNAEADSDLFSLHDLKRVECDEAVSHPWSREQVAVMIDLNREIVLKRFPVNSDGTVEWCWLLPAPLWVCLAVLKHEKEANVLPIIFDDPEVYYGLQDQVSRHPEIFRILRDDLKMIDFPKYLNVRID